jgi:hypothetical protein
VVATITLCACRSADVSGDWTARAAAHDAIRARAEQHFANATFFKPRQTGDDSLAETLAPIIAQQVPAEANRPELSDIPSGGDPTDTAGEGHVVVYYAQSEVSLRGHAHTQMTYLWRYPATENASWRGVRMTLNADGSPVIWETLSSESKNACIYVAESLDRASSQAFGSPLEHRRYAVESSVQAHPHALVVRVLADGPVPMGPLVYVTAGSHEIATMLCRCMPSQVDNLTDGMWYELVPLDAVMQRRENGEGFELPLGYSRMNHSGFLSNVLRLPEAF